MIETRLAHWNQLVAEHDLQGLQDILAEDVLFYSPFFWKPKSGKVEAFRILSTVIDVFEDFVYHRQLSQENILFLEFSARVGEYNLKGIDLITFNDAGKIQTFEVMIRPANALQALGMEMMQRLAE